MPKSKRPRLRYAQQGKQGDYYNRLSPEERAWIERFDRETLAETFEHSDADLHQDPAAKREIHREARAARYDIVTAPAKSVLEAATKPVRKRGGKSRYGSPDDYGREAGENPEEAIIDAIDAE